LSWRRRRQLDANELSVEEIGTGRDVTGLPDERGLMNEVD